jgi:hypothetical protein
MGRKRIARSWTKEEPSQRQPSAVALWNAVWKAWRVEAMENVKDNCKKETKNPVF